MATTLTINLDDKSGPGLEELIRRLTQGESAAEDFGETVAQQVSPELEKLGEIHAELVKQNQSLVTSEKESISAFERLEKYATDYNNALVSLGDAYETSKQRAKEFWEFGKSVVDTIKDTGRVVSATGSAIKRSYQFADAIVSIDAAVARWLTVESVSKKVATSIAGIGSYVTGATIAWKGFLAVADRTGETLRQTADGFAFLESATEQQKEAFRDLQREAGEFGRTLQDQLRISGKSYADFSLEVTTNGDRIREAMGKLTGEISAPFRDVINMTKEWWRETNILGEAWKDFDENFSGRADNMVENLALMRGGVRQLRADILNLGGTGAGDKYLAELSLLEQQQEAVGKLAAANEKNRPDFAALREGNELRQRNIEQEKELVRLKGKGLNETSDFNREQQEIDRLRDELRAKAGQAAQEGRFATRRDDAGNVTLQGYDQEHARLMAVVDQRERELDAKREELHRRVIARVHEQEEESKRAGLKAIDDAMDRQEKAREERKRAEEKAERERRDAHVREVEDALRVDREKLRQKVREEEEATRASRQRMADITRQLEGGVRLGDAKSQAVQIERQTQQQILRLREQAMQQYVTGDVRGFFESQRQQQQILADSLRAQKELREKFSKEGNVLDQLKSQFTDKDIVNKIGTDRGNEAIRKLAERDKEGLKQFQRQQQYGDGHLSQDETLRANRFQAQMRREMEEAKRQAFRDAKGGRLGGEEVEKATNDLTRQTIDNAKKQGALGEQTVEGLKAALETQKAAANKADQQGQEIEALKESFEEVRQMLDMGGPGGGSARGRALRGGRR